LRVFLLPAFLVVVVVFEQAVVPILLQVAPLQVDLLLLWGILHLLRVFLLLGILLLQGILLLRTLLQVCHLGVIRLVVIWVAFLVLH